MKKLKISLITKLLIAVIISGIFCISKTQAEESAVVEVKVQISVCGNEIKESGEDCDNKDFGSATCSNQGFTSGNLDCTPACEFDTSNCTSTPLTSGGVWLFTPQEKVRTPNTTKITFRGYSFPKSTVTLLKDSQVFAITTANSDAYFEFNNLNLTPGNYYFIIYAEDNKNNRSSIITYPLNITRGTTTKIDNIQITPTISSDKNTVKPGEKIKFYGQSIPNKNLTIEIGNPEENYLVETKTDKNGNYFYDFNTSILTHQTNYFAKTKIGNFFETSPYGKATNFSTGEKTILTSLKKLILGDLNNDNKVDLKDFSLAAYWYKKQLPLELKNVEYEKLDRDQKITLKDFSIIAHNWTG